MRRTYKLRFFSLLLTLTLLAVCAFPALGAESGFANFQKRINTYTEDMFPDVPPDWYTEYVAAVYELGLMQGDTEGRFRPDSGVTLAETAALAARLHRIWNAGSAAFDQGEPWYQAYVDYCRENGILTGDFADWSAPAKRSEFASLLSRALPVSALPEINAVVDDAIPDVPAGIAEAPGIYLLYRAGVLTGGDQYGTFSPDSEIRRSEVAAILSRMAFRSLRRTVSLVPKPAWPDLAWGERQSDAFFADAAMLGNSLVDGMRLCSGINSMSFYGETGSTVYNNRISQLLQKKFGKVYIEFGINEVGISEEEFISRYRRIVERIRETMPEADVYIMSITPVTKAVSSRGTFTMQRITAMNAALRALAEEEQCWYLDCCTPLCTAEGYLVEKYAGWDGSPHLDVSGYEAWAEAIRTHYAPTTDE